MTEENKRKEKHPKSYTRENDEKKRDGLWRRLSFFFYVTFFMVVVPFDFGRGPFSQVMVDGGPMRGLRVGADRCRNSVPQQSLRLELRQALRPNGRRVARLTLVLDRCGDRKTALRVIVVGLNKIGLLREREGDVIDKESPKIKLAFFFSFF